MRNKRPAARNIGIDIDQQVIDVWRGGDIPCELIQDDAIAYLSTFPYQGSELVYADPPYVHSTRKRSKSIVMNIQMTIIAGCCKCLPGCPAWS